MPKRKPTNDSGRAAKKRATATPPAAGATAAGGQAARRLQFSRDRSREAVAAPPVLGESEEEIGPTHPACVCRNPSTHTRSQCCTWSR